MILYRVESDRARVVPVECGDVGSKDADGHTVYVNTHYAKESDALLKLVVELEARNSILSDSRAECMRRTKLFTRRLACAARLLVRAKRLATAPVAVCSNERCGARVRGTVKVRREVSTPCCVACHGPMTWEVNP